MHASPIWDDMPLCVPLTANESCPTCADGLSCFFGDQAFDYNGYVLPPVMNHNNPVTS